MATNPYTARREKDGALDVWVAGWHIAFPSDAGTPRVNRADPAQGPDVAVAGLAVDSLGERTAVRWRDWIVKLSTEKFELHGVKPKAKVGGGGFWRTK